MLHKTIVCVGFIFAFIGAAHAETPLEALSRSKNCLACHAVDKKIVGPSFRSIAEKYQRKDTAKLVAKIQLGGAGVWGSVPMPANLQVTPLEAQTFVGLILALK